MTDSKTSMSAAKEFLDHNMPEEALAILDKMYIDTDGEVLFLKGEICYKLQMWGEALNHFSGFLEQFPGDSKAKSYCIMIRDILGFFHKDLNNP